MPPRAIRVLIVDDSAMVRKLLSRGLSEDPTIEVVGTAPDPYVARDKIVQLRPDVMTLDIEMPRMDGVEFLRRLMPQYPLPTVVLSAYTEDGTTAAMEALEAGAVDVVAKPKLDIARGLDEMLLELRTKIKIASTANVTHWKRLRGESLAEQTIRAPAGMSHTRERVIAIGASTGGTEALREIVSTLPVTTPGVVIVQHMPSGFTRMFADRLNSLSQMDVKEAADGDRVMAGRVLIAPGGYQTRLTRSGSFFQVDVTDDAPVTGHKPSVDALFHSVAEVCGSKAVAAILTGMGADGAAGMKALHDAGARTIAQDSETCVVYGMPKEAHARGAVDYLIPLDRISGKLLDVLEETTAN